MEVSKVHEKIDNNLNTRNSDLWHKVFWSIQSICEALSELCPKDMDEPARSQYPALHANLSKCVEIALINMKEDVEQLLTFIEGNVPKSEEEE
jgi:hypothetical protein